jgi:small subunit ribosomal protein S25e
MGGKKKQSMKQMSKAQRKKPSKKEKHAAGPSAEKKSIPGITPPSLKGEKVLREIKRLKVITPSIVASLFDLRLSVAKNLLREMERKGLIEFVSKSPALRIYKPAG